MDNIETVGERKCILFERDIRDQKGPWAPGWYLNRCHQCGKQFVGDKLARMCAPCAYEDPPNTQIHVGLVLQPKEHLQDWPDEKAEVVRHDLKLGWFIVVGDNFSRWYKDEADIWKDFDEIKK